MTDPEANAPLIAATETAGEAAAADPFIWDVKASFTPIVGSISVLLAVAYALFTKYSADVDTEEMYMYYIHVAIMIFVGFGFLMTFLKRYSLGAVSLNFVASVMMLLFGVLLHGAFEVDYSTLSFTSDWKTWQFIDINIGDLIQGLFCAGAGMISFGALLGKVSPTQLMLLLFLEVPLYMFNAEYLVGGIFGKQGAQDIGGSIAIHAFGAYFGLAATYVLYSQSPKATVGGDAPKNGSSYLNDVTSMIGTIFLWIYWPSFNAAVALPTADGMLASQLRMFAIVNTVISLCGACLSTFVISPVLLGKFDMVLIQNATLAGGVAVGSATTMIVEGAIVNITPGGALVTGLFAGLLSSWGFASLSGTLEDAFGLKDTCGVNNLHGMPGILGGLVAAAALFFNGSYAPFMAQLLALGCTVGIALVGGALSAFLVSGLGGPPADIAKKVYEDAAAFTVEEEE